LAREASTENIHRSTPGSTVEGFDIVPDGSVIEKSIDLTLANDLLAIFVPFDVTYGPGLDTGEAESEAESAVAGEKIEGIEGMYIHVMLAP